MSSPKSMDAVPMEGLVVAIVSRYKAAIPNVHFFVKFGALKQEIYFHVKYTAKNT